MRSTQKGFSLLEVMIVLALVGLITGLFLDPIARVFDVKTRLSHQIDNVALNILPQNWVRAVLNGTYMTKTKFSGDAKKVNGITIHPLLDDIGVPTTYELSLSYDSVNDLTLLNYQGFGEEILTLAEWQGDRGAFSYFNPETQNWEAEWQSGSFVQKEQYKLPLYVRLDGFFDNQPWTILSNLEPSRPYVESESDKLQKMVEDMKARQLQEKEKKEIKKEEKKNKFITTQKIKEDLMNQSDTKKAEPKKTDKPPSLPQRKTEKSDEAHEKLQLPTIFEEDDDDDDFDDDED